MTDDLVQRLRSDAGFRKASPIMREAADEIVRLQAANSTLHAALDVKAEMALQDSNRELRAEVERLQADNQRMAEVYELAARSAHAASLFQGGAGGRDNPQAVAVHMAEWFEEQEAEVVRLQQALRDLLPFAEDVDLLVRNATVSRADAVAAARAVLEGNQQ